MFESIIQQGYWYMFMQVVVTLLLFPFFNAKRFKDNANAYCARYYPEAKSELEKYKARSFTLLTIIVLSSFCVALAIVVYAYLHKIELLNWDNQAGLSVLFIIAMLPVATIAFMQKGLFSLFKKFADGKRIATLKQANWISYFAIPLLIILVLGQFLFIATVSYFAMHPFAGFAGYYNLFGLLLIDAVFIGVCYAIYNSKKMAAIKAPEERVAIKIKAIKINMIIWIVCIYHLSASMWVAGLELKELNLITQSLYLQVTIFLTAYATSLPKPPKQLNG